MYHSKKMILIHVGYWDEVKFLLGRKWHSRCKKSRVANYLEMEKTTMPRTVDCARIVGMIATLQLLSDKGSSSQALYSWDKEIWSGKSGSGCKVWSDWGFKETTLRTMRRIHHRGRYSMGFRGLDYHVWPMPSDELSHQRKLRSLVSYLGDKQSLIDIEESRFQKFALYERNTENSCFQMRKRRKKMMSRG